MSEKTYLKKKDVLERGWTQGLIRKHLGEPDQTRNGRNNIICLFDVVRVEAAEQSDPFRADLAKLQTRRNLATQTVECDLLAAIFAVNRAAKRHRDVAGKQYDAGNYGFATKAKEHKQRLYTLKDRGIAYAFHLGRIAPAVMHGALCLYRGEGYSFHSTLRPKDIPVPVSADGQDEPVFIDAKPQGAKEPKQRDAIAMLESLPNVDYARFDIVAPPQRARTVRNVECYNCGQLGHIARDCPQNDFADDYAEGFEHYV